MEYVTIIFAVVRLEIWLSERLWMGDESGVSKAIRSVKEGRDAALERARKKLLKRAGHGGQIKNRFTS